MAFRMVVRGGDQNVAFDNNWSPKVNLKNIADVQHYHSLEQSAQIIKEQTSQMFAKPTASE